MIVYLVRHFETDWNRRGLYQGWTERPLSARGRQEARRAGSKLRGLLSGPFALWSTDLRRGIESARLLFPSREPRADARLRELHFGEFEGRSWAENMSRFGDRFSAWVENEGEPPPPGGEPIIEFRRRIDAWWSEASAAPVVVAITHGGVLRHFTHRFSGDGVHPSNGVVLRITGPDNRHQLETIHLLPREAADA